MKKLLWVILAGLILAAAVGIYLYFKPVKDLHKAKPDFQFTVFEQLYQILPELENNPEKFVGKIFEITGVVTEFSSEPDGGGYIVMESEELNLLVNAQMDYRVMGAQIPENSSCTIRAEFTGIEEDLLDPEVKIIYLKQAVIL